MEKWKNILLLLLCLSGVTIQLKAHPGIGMVYDGKNIIYYTDLANIWQYDLITRQSSILIPNVHSHEICLDSLGNLYGEHYFYLENQQQFRNYIWKYSKPGKLSIIRQELPGENADFSFVRDQQFRPFLFENSSEGTAIYRSMGDDAKLLHQQKFKDLRWKSIDQQNNLLLIDLHSLYRLNEQGRMEVLAEDLASTKFPFSFNDEKHNVYATWTDQLSNTFVAVYGGRQIKKVDAMKAVSVVYQSPFFWSPLNGLFDQHGRLWVMEGSLWGATRIRLVEQAEESNWGEVNIGLILALILILFALINRKKRSLFFFNSGIH